MFVYFVSLLGAFCLYIIAMSILSLVINVMRKGDSETALGERWYTFIFIVYSGIVSSIANKYCSLYASWQYYAFTIIGSSDLTSQLTST